MPLALFQKRISGDDSLLELARLRFRQAGMGVETHAETTEELDWIMNFLPSSDAVLVAHLSRDIDLLHESGRRQILDFATRFAGRVFGLVVHDRPEMAARLADFIDAANQLQSGMAKVSRCPNLFIEYAVGLDPTVYADLFAPLQHLTLIGPCIDIGHLGIWHVRRAYGQIHPGEDVCALKPGHPKLPTVIADVDKAVSAALPAVLSLIGVMGQFHQPIHFHLHDGHPLSTFSPFGVSDHLSFLMEMPIGFEYHGACSLPLMFGPAGLSRVIAKVEEAIGLKRCSFTLEIHPTADRLPLGDAEPLFAHWRDKTHAEQMNHWLAVLAENHRLLLSTLNHQLTS